MTENEAIKHARKVAEDKRADADWEWRHGRLNSDDCIKCAEEHEQLANWIEELQQYRAIGTVDECRKTVEQLKVAKEAIRKLLCSEYGSSYQFCVHDNNEDAICCNVGGSSSWCSENAKWNGRLE